MFQKYLQRLSSHPRNKLIYLTIALTGITVLVLIISLSGGARTWQIEDPAASEERSTSSMIWDVIFKLILVIALIYGFLYFLRTLQSKSVIGGKEKTLAVQDTLRLSPKQSIYLIRAGEKSYLVGATDQAMSLIAEVALENPIKVSALEVVPAPNPSFDHLLQKSLERTSETNTDPATKAAPVDWLESRKNE